ncbi:hypothetical protein [Acetobacter papayae]|uniref:hypothetical protein n=1 Tax=Acetobacter papayae TaxID=1076592 RepID=UPI0004726649|nr:hypothetical protein [Acetobacter papayae]
MTTPHSDTTTKSGDKLSFTVILRKLYETFEPLLMLSLLMMETAMKWCFIFVFINICVCSALFLTDFVFFQSAHIEKFRFIYSIADQWGAGAIIPAGLSYCALLLGTDRLNISTALSNFLNARRSAHTPD